MQVSGQKVSEKAFSKWGRTSLDGWPPLYIAKWKRSDILNYMLIINYMLIVYVQLAPTPTQLKQAIGPSAGQEGRRVSLSPQDS